MTWSNDMLSIVLHVFIFSLDFVPFTMTTFSQSPLSNIVFKLVLLWMSEWVTSYGSVDWQHKLWNTAPDQQPLMSNTDACQLCRKKNDCLTYWLIIRQDFGQTTDKNGNELRKKTLIHIHLRRRLIRFVSGDQHDGFSCVSCTNGSNRCNVPVQPVSLQPVSDAETCLLSCHSERPSAKHSEKARSGIWNGGATSF